jgi:hypothetical protein
MLVRGVVERAMKLDVMENGPVVIAMFLDPMHLLI